MPGGRAVLATVLCASCSFFAVKGPQTRSRDATCTESDVIPSLDAVAGGLLVAGGLVGEIFDHISAHPIAHYELVIGLPALAVGITYLVAAARGTDRVSTCQAVKRGQALRGCDGCPAEVP